MQARLLIFDPDSEGRQSIRAAVADLALELSLIVRATGRTAAHALQTMSLDGVLVGLPAELPDIIPVLTELQTTGDCPPLFFFHKEPVEGEHSLTKDARGFERLREILIPEIRAYKLKRGIASLEPFQGQSQGSARSLLANQITDILAGLDLPAMYVSVDTNNQRWDLRSSNFPPEINSAVITITDSHGGVVLDPELKAGPLKRLYAGELRDHVFQPDELLQTILPAVSTASLRQLENALGVPSIHVIAVRTSEQLNGYLLVGHTPHGREREALRRLGHEFGSLLDQAARYDLLNQQARSLSTIQEVMLSLSATLDPGDLLDNVLEKLERVVPYDLAAIALHEQDTLNVRAGRGDRKDLSTLEASLENAGEQPGIIASLLANGEPHLINTIDLEMKQDPGGLGSMYASWLGVPISWGTEELGHLFLASINPGVLEAIHLEVSITFARQLAIALENAYLLAGSHSRAEKLRLVNDIGRYAISVLDTQQLVEEVASRVYEVFEYYAVRILLVEGDDLVPYALGGEFDDLLADPEHVIALEEVQELSQVVQQASPLYLDVNSPRWRRLLPSQLEGARAVVIIPLSVASEVIGVMEVYAQEAKALGREDVDVLQVLAAQIAISVVNARLFNEIRSHAVELESRVELRTQELQSQKERTEAILRSVADAVLVLDSNGVVVLANPSAQELLEGSHGQALSESVRALFVAEGVVQSSVEIGEVTFQALASPVEFKRETQGTVVVLRDITKLKELDQLKSQFVATVSHELRTPLTNIKLYLSLLRRAEDEKRTRYHKVLVRETERLSDMIEDLLNLSRLEAQGVLHKDPVALVELLQLVADNHEPACVSKGIHFSTDFAHGAKILADRAQIIQVFTNLLANAIAYTPVGGEITLRAAGTESFEAREYAKVVLQDTGIGIRKEDIPHVFDRFYRGAGAQNYQADGSGLGLAIVREILDNHDAMIAVDSQPGEGTKFTVWLPALGK